MSQASFVSRPLRSDDVPAVVDLFGEVFGRRISPEHYVWKLRRRESPVDNVAIAVDDGDRPVFHIGGVLCRAQVAGQDRLVMVAVDAMTHPRARRRGLLTKHAGELYGCWKDAGVAVILGMPNENYGSRARALGWRSLTSLQWMLLPLRPERMLARKLRVPWLGRLSIVGTAWRSLMVHARQRSGEIDVRQVTALDATFDGLWKRARPALGHSLARDSAWVAWRYLDDPSRRYRVLQATRGAEVVGYMVCGVAEPAAVTIPEIFTVPGDEATFESLVAFAVRQYASAGADSLRTLAIPNSWTHAQLRRLGFISMRHQFPVEYIPLDPSEIGSDEGLATGWHLAGGDFDVV